MMTQALELAKRPHVIVATPGRIVDHLKSNNGEWSLSRVRFLVSGLVVTKSPDLILFGRFWTRPIAY
jgi:hypothetical protein